MSRAARRFAWLCVVSLGTSPSALTAQNPAAPAGPIRLTMTTSSADAKAAFSAAQDALARLDFAAWQAQVERAVAADPKFALARGARALSLAGAEAEAEMNRALWLSGSATPAERVLIYSYNEWLKSMPSRFLGQAAAMLVPDDDRVLFDTQALWGAGTAVRVAAARELVKRNPTSAVARANLSRSLAAADSAEARQAAEEALRLGPREPFAHESMGREMIRRRRLDDAATHFRHALEIDPRYYWAHQGLAVVSSYKRQYAEARQHLSQVINLSTVPEQAAEARRLGALTHLHERNIEHATRAAEEAARLAEADGRRSEAVLAHRILTVIAGVRRDENAVRQHLAEQDRLGRFDALHHYWAALAWVQAGRPDLARVAVQALEKENDNADVIVVPATLQIVRGAVLQAEGKDEEALTVLGNSLNHWAIIARYEALKRLGRTAEAERLLRGFFDAVVYDVYGIGLPVARYRFGDVAGS